MKNLVDFSDLEEDFIFLKYLQNLDDSLSSTKPTEDYYILKFLGKYWQHKQYIHIFSLLLKKKITKRKALKIFNTHNIFIASKLIDLEESLKYLKAIYVDGGKKTKPYKDRFFKYIKKQNNIKKYKKSIFWLKKHGIVSFLDRDVLKFLPKKFT